METSEDIIRGNVDSLTKLFAAFESLGLELIYEGAVSQGDGRGVRLKKAVGARLGRIETGERVQSASPMREGRR